MFAIKIIKEPLSTNATTFERFEYNISGSNICKGLSKNEMNIITSLFK